MSLSVTIKSIAHLKKKARYAENGDLTSMSRKLEFCERLLCYTSAKLVKIVDPRFFNGVKANSGLPRHVKNKPELLERTEAISNETSVKRYLCDELTDENCTDVHEDDETDRFIREAFCSNRSIVPLQWCKVNEKRYPNIAAFARDFLDSQASSVASESIFPLANQILNGSHLRLDDETIQSSVLFKSWNNFFNK